MNRLIILSILVIIGLPLSIALSSDVSKPKSFPIGPFYLDMPSSGIKDLLEISIHEYEVFGKSFKDEKIYRTSNIEFIGFNWNVMLGVVRGRVYKINPEIETKNKKYANEVAMKSYEYCTSKLGEPAEKRTGFFVWDTSDGNVILQTNETKEGFVIYLFSTSKSVRNYERLR